jgi:hypothetical protein
MSWTVVLRLVRERLGDYYCVKSLLTVKDKSGDKTRRKAQMRFLPLFRRTVDHVMNEGTSTVTACELFCLSFNTSPSLGVRRVSRDSWGFCEI